jgi:hypothetical protein
MKVRRRPVLLEEEDFKEVRLKRLGHKNRKGKFKYCTDKDKNQLSRGVLSALAQGKRPTYEDTNLPCWYEECIDPAHEDNLLGHVNCKSSMKERLRATNGLSRYKRTRFIKVRKNCFFPDEKG